MQSAETNTPPADCETIRAKYGKDLWVTEGAVDGGYGPQKSFAAGNVTGYLMWPLVPSFYPMMPFGSPGNVGVLTAFQPWSGNYLFSSTIAVTAHMTQFTAARGACTFVPNSAVGTLGNGYVDAASSVIATAFDCGTLGWTVVLSPLPGLYNTTSTLTVRLDGQDTPGARRRALDSVAPSGEAAELWGSCGLTGTNASQWMQRLTHSLDTTASPAGAPPAHEYSFTVEKDCIYTLSTVATGGGLQRAMLGAIPTSAPLPLPLVDSFDDPARKDGIPARFFQSLSGTFSLQHGLLAQVVPRRPIEWQKNCEPSAVAGDQRFGTDGKLVSSWVDYTVAVSGRVDSVPVDVGADSYLRVCGRINHYEQK